MSSCLAVKVNRSSSASDLWCPHFATKTMNRAHVVQQQQRSSAGAWNPHSWSQAVPGDRKGQISGGKQFGPHEADSVLPTTSGPQGGWGGPSNPGIGKGDLGISVSTSSAPATYGQLTGGSVNNNGSGSAASGSVAGGGGAGGHIGSSPLTQEMIVAMSMRTTSAGTGSATVIPCPLLPSTTTTTNLEQIVGLLPASGSAAEDYKGFVGAVETIFSKGSFVVVPYGSLITGLALDDQTADMDLTILDKRSADFICQNGWGSLVHLGTPAPSQAQRVTEIENLGKVAQGLEAAGYRDVVRVFRGAKVPLVKCKAPNSARDIDLTMSNFLAVRNSFLLRAYAVSAQGIRSFLLKVKRWSKKAGLIRDATNGLFSSYTFSLLAISYLLQTGRVNFVDPQNIFMANLSPFPPTSNIKGCEDGASAAFRHFLSFMLVRVLQQEQAALFPVMAVGSQNGVNLTRQRGGAFDIEDPYAIDERTGLRRVFSCEGKAAEKIKRAVYVEFGLQRFKEVEVVGEAEQRVQEDAVANLQSEVMKLKLVISLLLP